MLSQWILLVSMSVLVAFVPSRDPPGAAPLPQLAGLSNWGIIVQDGRKLSIGGHPLWTAHGEIRKDSTVFLLWEHCADGRQAPAVYRIDGDGLSGDWGWSDQVTLQADGSLAGQLFPDRVDRIKDEEP